MRIIVTEHSQGDDLLVTQPKRQRLNSTADFITQ